MMKTMMPIKKICGVTEAARQMMKMMILLVFETSRLVWMDASAKSTDWMMKMTLLTRLLSCAGDLTV